MHITHLEIDNFKSFGKKTKIPFFEGFTVISGPNGSGKSNIIDSILFVLALSSSRSLRAEKLTDLINLNSGRNVAEVEITFSDGTHIKRRIKRTDSTYYNYLYLNGKPCRQGDLLEFLSGFGIVPHGYNVVMQGDINRIIEMSDFERRKIIDEIAGVSEFDAKKALAYDELGRVRVRISEETAHLDELLMRLSHLGKQREQALVYKSWQERLNHLTSCRYAAMLAARKHEMEMLISGIEEEKKNLLTLDGDISWTTHERDFLKQEITEIDRQISEKTGSEYMTLVTRIAEAKAAIDGFHRSIDHNEKEKEENDKRLSELYTALKKQEERLEEKSVVIRDLMIDRTNLAMTVSTVISGYTKIQAEIEKQKKNYELDDLALMELRESYSKKRDERVELIKDQDLLIERSRLRSTEIDRLGSKIVSLEHDREVKKEEIRINAEKLATLVAEKREYDQRVGILDTTLYAKREAYDILLKKIRDLKIEINKREAQQQAQGRYGKALEAVLGMDDVFGTIADLATCKREYTIALNVATGAKLHFVVVENDQVAADAISFLQERKLGRVTFLPLNKLRPKPLPPLPSGHDIIGYAIDLLEFDYRYEKAFQVILSGTVVIDTLDNARRRVGQFRMVTLDGSLLEPSGSMTGGSIKKEIEGFGSNSEDELRMLNGELSHLSGEESALVGDMESLSSERDTAQKRRMDLEGELIRSKTIHEELTRQISGFEEEVTLLRQQCDEYRLNTESGSSDLADIEKKISVLTSELTRIQEEIQNVSTRMEGTGVPALLDELDIEAKKKDESERRLRNKENDINEAQMERTYIQKSIDEQRQQMDRVKEQNSRLDQDIVRANEEITTKQSEIKEVETILSKFSKVIEDLQVKRNDLVGQMDTFEINLRELAMKRERITVKIEGLEEKNGLLDKEILELTDHAGDTTTELTVEEIEQGISEAQTEISRIGDVNMKAIEEYDQVNVVATERKERLAILEKELEEINDRIEFFSKKKYEAFMGAFKAIDQNFREIFARLTNGSGELMLENSEDPFTGGLTFMVQPQDKKVHHLNSLSGGEKSLTTLAFIFSIQKYIPAPFYAFDEVDMNLDGSNVERIADMIRELSQKSQFIDISLRKPVIDIADRIIGVTIRPDKSTLVTGVSVFD